ncbi:MAG: hypothetical protein JNL30_04510 [Rubrivivax sp.]|nr:hypothetical protein [Rubrivivax sp.]
MAALRERLSWETAEGAVADGPRRYLLMRPDVLMGALVRLDEAARRSWLGAVAESARVQGGESLAAYAATVGHDSARLLEATASAAADLGWGRWVFTHAQQAPDEVLQLEVHGSPFAAGWLAAGGGTSAQPVCAPVCGMLAALASLLWPGRPVQVREQRCGVAGQPPAATCAFEARPQGPLQPPGQRRP